MLMPSASVSAFAEIAREAASQSRRHWRAPPHIRRPVDPATRPAPGAVRACAIPESAIHMRVAIRRPAPPAKASACSARRRSCTASWPIARSGNPAAAPASPSIPDNDPPCRPGSQFSRQTRRPIARSSVGFVRMPALRFAQFLHRRRRHAEAARSVHGLPYPRSSRAAPAAPAAWRDRRRICLPESRACRSARAGRAARAPARAAYRGMPCSQHPQARRADCRCPPSKHSADSAAPAFCVSYQLSRCPSYRSRREGFHRLRDAAAELIRRQITEIARGERRRQPKPDVGGRRAFAQLPRATPAAYYPAAASAVSVRHKIVEKTPGLPRQTAQELRLVARQLTAVSVPLRPDSHFISSGDSRPEHQETTRRKERVLAAARTPASATDQAETNSSRRSVASMCRRDSAWERAAVCQSRACGGSRTAGNARVQSRPRPSTPDAAGTQSLPACAPVRPPRPAIAARNRRLCAQSAPAAGRWPAWSPPDATSRLHDPGMGDSNHPSNNNSSAAMETRLRRRLSKMRQRLMNVSGFFSAPAPAQAPRTSSSARSASRRESSGARGWRSCRNRAADARRARCPWPARRPTYAPSIRSWLRIVSSGKRSFRIVWKARTS